MPFKSIEDKRKFQREWLAKRKADWLAENGPCVVCGSSEGLEVDHVDPAQKLSHKVWSWSKERREAELKKCQVLCNVHHKEKTSAHRALALFHGNPSMYRKGCRCDLCKAGAAADKAKRRLKFQQSVA